MHDTPVPLLVRHPEMARWQVLLFGLTAGLVTGVDFIAGAMIGIAGNHIRGGVHATPEEYLWTVSGYAAAAVVANLVIGRAAQRYSYRRYTLASLLVFGGGSLACAAATDINMLIVARVIQGLGGGGLFTAARVIVQMASNQPRERLRLFWGFGLGANGLMAFAPWLSAELVETCGWQAVFLLQAGVAACLLPLVLASFPRHASKPSVSELGALDWPAVLAFGLGALLLLHGLQDLRYLRPDALWFGTLCGLALLLFIATRLHHHPDPWLDVRRLASRRYLVGLGFYGLFYLINGGWGLLLSTFLQDGMGFTFSTTGALMTAGGMVTLLCVVLHTWQLPRLFGKRWVIVAGFAMLMLACLLLSQAAMPGASAGVLLPAIALQGSTFVLISIQVASLTYRDFDESDFAHAYQLKNIMRELTSAFGLGLTSVLLQDGRAVARTELTSHVDATVLSGVPEPEMLTWLQQLSGEIDRQSTLIAADHIFLLLAVVAVIGGIVAGTQRVLR